MDIWFNRRGEAIRDYIKGDSVEKRAVIEKFPDIPDKSLVISAVNSGFGDLKTCHELIEKYGADYIADMIRFQQIGQELNGS